MANLLRLTVKRDERTNKVHLKKGMYVEMICNSRTPSTKEKEKICIFSPGNNRRKQAMQGFLCVCTKPEMVYRCN